ncbi:hypothetical protein MMC18_008177 [Xylographa bjoerkii]|nr:hypothetical protein [Xylographa bjoerkii]
MTTLRPFVFENLPRELRDKIYHELLVADNWFCGDDEGLCMPFVEDPPSGCNPAILATSKKIHDEAALVFYGKNRFYHEIYGISPQPFLGSHWRPDKCLPKKYINLINHLSVCINFKGSDTDFLGDVPAFEIVRSNVKQVADNLADNHHIAIFKLSFINSYFNVGMARQWPNSFRGNWAMGEQVLAPLAALRGVTKVVLEDHAQVSKYAQVLKRLMMLSPA